MIGGLAETWARVEAIRAHTAETPKQTSLHLRLRALHFYPDLYVQPARDRVGFVEKLILHNAIVPFAAKTKLLLSIGRESNGPKLSRDKFIRLLNIRNAFAHGTF